jgi:CHAT domain-containing protein
LQSVFGSECVPPRDALKPQELRAGEVLLYPLLLPDRIELLYAVGGGDGSYKRLPPNRSADRNTVSRLVEQMVISMSYGEDEEWRGPARQLYDLLIKPIEAELGANGVLAIIPDGPLRRVPFAALMAEDGRFLISGLALPLPLLWPTHSLVAAAKRRCRWSPLRSRRNWNCRPVSSRSWRALPRKRRLRPDRHATAVTSGISGRQTSSRH